MTTAEHRARVLAHQEKQGASAVKTASSTPGASNRPPLASPDQLAHDFEHLVNAADELTVRAAHEVPPVVEDDDDLAVITAYVKDIRSERKRIAEIADGEKRPYLEAQRTLHAWFTTLATRLGELQDAVEARGNAYLAKKQSEERRHREEVERKARAEAEAARLAAIEAAKQVATIKEMSTSENNVRAHPEMVQNAQAAMTLAAEAEDKADAAARAVAAKPADLSRTRTTAGTASISTKIEFSFDRDKVDLEALRPFLREDELRAAINAIAIKNREAIIAGTFTLAGVNFYQKARGFYR